MVVPEKQAPTVEDFYLPKQREMRLITSLLNFMINWAREMQKIAFERRLRQYSSNSIMVLKLIYWQYL